jgi:hypothetical protein
MKNLPLTLNLRDRERGAVALVIAVMWMALFGMAVMAVDFGYLYTKKRGLQSVADAVLRGTMPMYLTGGLNTATQNRATQIAGLNGFVDGVGGAKVRLTEPSGPNNQLQVLIGGQFPTFFGGIFGLTPREVDGIAVGQLTGGGGGGGGGNIAIYTSDAPAACPPPIVWGTGFTIQGIGSLVINGDVAGTSKIEFGWMKSPCTPSSTQCQLNGSVLSPCGATIDATDGSFVVTGTTTASAAPADPLAADTFAVMNAACPPGKNATTTLAANYPAGLPWGPEAGGCNPLPPGIYCASDPINVTPPGPGQSICPTNATFISASNVNIQANGSINITAAPGAPDGIIAYAAGPGTCAIPSVQLANGPATFYNLTGSVYAPNGCLNVGSGTPGFTMTGTLDGKVINVSIGPGSNWTFNGPGGGGGGGGGGSPTGWKIIR